MRTFFKKLRLYFFLIFILCINYLSVLSNSNFIFTGSQPGLTKEEVKNKFKKDGLSLLPFAFIENKGQIRDKNNKPRPEVKFIFSKGDLQIFLLEKGIAYQFTKTNYPKEYFDQQKKNNTALDPQFLKDIQKEIHTETYRMDMTLQGANPNAWITAEGRSENYVQYFNENAFDVHNYTKIIYHDVYPAIDWVIYTLDNQVKYDFIVKPGGDPSLIKMQFTNHEELRLNKNGSITAKNSLGSITEKTPLSFQEEKNITTAFKMKGNTISFCLGNYNKNKSLIIDPALSWATYYGGSGTDHAYSCSIDNSGNVYLAGYTASTNNIALNGYQNSAGASGNCYLAKFTSSGTLLWATYYGGYLYGGAIVLPVASCAVDPSGNIYLAGTTTYTSGIASSGHQNTFAGGGIDAFLVKFDASGTRLWGTYYGGLSDDYGFSVTTDNAGNVYMAGSTSSSTNIASAGHQNTYGGGADAFLVKFNASGGRQWGTYYGDSGADDGYGCATDPSGNIYLVGKTASSSSIATSGYQSTFGGNTDGYIVKFNSSGVRQWATYVGGSNYDEADACATDASGNIFITGQIYSGGLALNAHQSIMYSGGEAYLAKFNGSGVLQWFTYYGQLGFDWGHACATDAAGSVYLVGETSSTSNISDIGYQNTIGGGTDAFLVKFNSNGIRQWGTYYGGTATDNSFGCAVDASNNIYLTGYTSSTVSISSGGLQNNYGGGNYDGYLAKFCDQPIQPTAITGNTAVCSGNNQTYFITAVPFATSYNWAYPGGWTGSSTGNGLSVSPFYNGVINVTASNNCGTSHSQTLSLVVNPLPSITVSSGTVCNGASFNINPSGANTYTITGGFPIVSPSLTSSYSVTGTSTAGCVSTTPAVSNVTVNPTPVISVNSGSICYGQSFTINPSGANTYTFSSPSAIISPTTNSTYSVSGTSLAGCVSSVTAISSVTVKPLPVISVNSGVICYGQSFTLMPTGVDTYTYSSGSPIVTPIANASYTITGTALAGCVATAIAVSNVTVNPYPIISVNSGAICDGQSFTIAASGAATYTYSGGSTVVSPTTSTNYSISGTNNLGCTSPAPAISQVIVNPLPQIHVTSSDSSICAGETLSLSAIGANSYIWNSSFAGIMIVVSPTVTTIYTITGTDGNGCNGLAQFTQTVDACTSVLKNYNLDPEILIYPNPNPGRLFIKLNTSTTSYSLRLMNLLGQNVLFSDFSESTSIDLSEFSNGIYFVGIYNGNERIKYEKIIKE